MWCCWWPIRRKRRRGTRRKKEKQPADWYTGPLMQLQLFIQMLSGGADDRGRDAFQGKPPAFPSQPQKTTCTQTLKEFTVALPCSIWTGGVLVEGWEDCGSQSVLGDRSSAASHCMKCVTVIRFSHLHLSALHARSVPRTDHPVRNAFYA